MTHPTLRRRLVVLLARHAQFAFPPSRARWADAILVETRCLPDDWTALNWAVGGVFAAYAERFRVLRLMDLRVVRYAVALLIGLKALSDFFATALTVAYHTGALRVAGFLGGGTQGDDFRRFIPLMEITPFWIHAMWVGAGTLYLAALARLVRRTPNAHVLIGTAVGIDVLAELASRPFTTASGVVVNPGQPMLALLVPFALPLIAAALLWDTERRAVA